MNSLQNPLNANYPQDVTQKPGENAVFIVYALKDLPDTIDKVKDVCANFSALIRSMRNRYPDMQFSYDRIRGGCLETFLSGARKPQRIATV